MVLHDKARFFGCFSLALLNSVIEKLKYFVALDTHHMVVVAGIVEFKYRGPPFKIVADDKTGRFKLGQHPVDSRKTNVLIECQ